MNKIIIKKKQHEKAKCSDLDARRVTERPVKVDVNADLFFATLSSGILYVYCVCDAV